MREKGIILSGKKIRKSLTKAAEKSDTRLLQGCGPLSVTRKKKYITNYNLIFKQKIMPLILVIIMQILMFREYLTTALFLKTRISRMKHRNMQYTNYIS